MLVPVCFYIDFNQVGNTSELRITRQSRQRVKSHVNERQCFTLGSLITITSPSKFHLLTTYIKHDLCSSSSFPSISIPTKSSLASRIYHDRHLAVLPVTSPTATIMAKASYEAALDGLTEVEKNRLLACYFSIENIHTVVDLPPSLLVPIAMLKDRCR